MSCHVKTAARPPGRPPTADMVWIPGGTFRMGSNDHYPEEVPAHDVAVDGFWIDRLVRGPARRGLVGRTSVNPRGGEPERSYDPGTMRPAGEAGGRTGEAP